MGAIQAHFKEWLQATGAMRQVRPCTPHLRMQIARQQAPISCAGVRQHALPSRLGHSPAPCLAPRQVYDLARAERDAEGSSGSGSAAS